MRQLHTKLLAAVLSVALLSACNISEGERHGQISKLSKRGVLCKTWEGELATFARGKTSTAMMNTFEFSVEDPAVVKDIQKAMRSGKDVSLLYEQEFFLWPCEHDSVYVVTEVVINAGDAK